MGTFYDSLKRRLVLLCMLALFLIIAAVHSAMYIVTKGIVTEQIGLGAQSIATAIANGILADSDGYRRFLETRDVDSEYYRRMQAYLTRIKESGTQIRFIYTERPVDDTTVEFVLDAEPPGSADYSAPGTTTFMDDASRKVYATKRPAMLEPTPHPTYGVLLGGCAPIVDAEGRLLGLVGVNLDISALRSQIETLQWIMLFLYGVISLAFLTLVNKYSNAILEPMVKDKLTGAYSKRYYETLVRLEIGQAVKRGANLALLTFDLDHFKKVNDTYGHAFGDRVLGAVSKTVMHSLRAKDSFIRFGGEEFAVLIANADPEIVLKIAERLRAAVEKTEIRQDTRAGSGQEGGPPAIRVTISIGVAHLDSRNDSERTLMEKADKALYAAKVTRNTVSLFKADA